jgi:sec-independent protein translocase protein TatC
VLPGFLLFIGGIIFGYFVLLPETFKTLYAHTPGLGIEAYFLAEQFVTTVLLFLGVSGCLFLIPVAMPLLTRIGIISQEAWIAGWRGAVIVILGLAAILTTDGSGVTMMLFSAPTITSYFVGMGVSGLVRKV